MWLLLTKVELFQLYKLMADIGGEQQPPDMDCVVTFSFHYMLIDKEDSVYRLLYVA